VSLSPREVHSIDDVLEAALRLLSYRPRSEAEVRRGLSRRFSPSLVEEAIARLTDMGLLDDAAFARFWRQNREQHRPRSAFAMKWELLRRGVSREVAAEALAGLDEEENAYGAARRMLHKLGQVDYDTFRKRVVTYLRRRGFGGEAIGRTVRRLWVELSDPAYGYIKGNAQDEQPEDVGQDKD